VANYYLETIEFKRTPQTLTELRLMRPEDMVIGSDEEAT
jgi:hypothetical protein